MFQPLPFNSVEAPRVAGLALFKKSEKRGKLILVKKNENNNLSKKKNVSCKMLRRLRHSRYRNLSCSRTCEDSHSHRRSRSHSWLFNPPQRRGRGLVRWNAAKKRTGRERSNARRVTSSFTRLRHQSRMRPFKLQITERSSLTRFSSNRPRTFLHVDNLIAKRRKAK